VDRDRLHAIYREESPTPADVAEAIAILERAGARTYTREMARCYRDEALAEIRGVEAIDEAARAQLEDIIVRVISA
jgi:geranylgeranyl pyrophosphate synthase